jgi:magnesium-transporting ATPase (P-type)
VTIEKTGKIVNITEDDLCEEDILLLQAGDLVPADLKLVEARGLEVDEFDLTGEIMPVAKKRVDEEDIFVYRGSRVTRGDGKGVVIATGEETEYGKILKQRWGQVKYRFPSLVKRRYFTLLVFLLPPLFISLTRYDNVALTCILYLAMAVFVVLMLNNELFKYVLTSNEVKKITSESIQMIDETSLDSINKIDIVCFDKTGVLTTREMEVERVHFADETADMDSFLSNKHISNLTGVACALCNDVIFSEKITQADPVDRALISFASKNGIDRNEIAPMYKKICEKPFDSEDRYMACGFEHKDKKMYFAKGDPDVILRMCKNYITTSGIEKNVTLDFLSSINAKTYSINQKGDVAIALAYSSGTSETPLPHYSFLCLLQLTNPVKPGVPEVIRNLKEKGKRTLILTGDRPETAMKIAGEIGIDNKSNYCLTGKTMAKMEFSEIARQSDHISVFARLSPSQKGILIMLLQQRNNSVAMVGDGANDTIALKVADVGISFVENSSPLAKRMSKILINDSADLLTIIQSARRLKWRVKYLMLSRIIGLISMLLVLYMLMLN